ncbi:MAG: lasso peptide biosynthesis protein [Caldilineales bacterium]|nr:lasso peptide biosynthesis protein [Caldilineales bacterium]
MTAKTHPRARWGRRLRLGQAALATLARSLASPHLRPLLPGIWRWSRGLPARYEAQSLPDFLTALTPAHADLAGVNGEHLRELIDLLARLDRGSPFGLCLRRALWRYHWLRRAGLPLGILFGVRVRGATELSEIGKAEPGGARIVGHAWNTLAGEPWHERPEDRRGFSVLYRWEGPVQSPV